MLPPCCLRSDPIGPPDTVADGRVLQAASRLHCCRTTSPGPKEAGDADITVRPCLQEGVDTPRAWRCTPHNKRRQMGARKRAKHTVRWGRLARAALRHPFARAPSPREDPSTNTSTRAGAPERAPQQLGGVGGAGTRRYKTGAGGPGGHKRPDRPPVTPSTSYALCSETRPHCASRESSPCEAPERPRQRYDRETGPQQPRDLGAPRARAAHSEPARPPSTARPAAYS